MSPEEEIEEWENQLLDAFNGLDFDVRHKYEEAAAQEGIEVIDILLAVMEAVTDKQLDEMVKELDRQKNTLDSLLGDMQVDL